LGSGVPPELELPPLLLLPLLAPLLPLLLPVPLLLAPLPLPLLLPLLLPPASPLFGGLSLLEPPHAAAIPMPTDTDTASKTLTDFIQATSGKRYVRRTSFPSLRATQ
jgi:hypothetical protein